MTEMRTAYESDSYRVQVNEAGAEITNRHTGATKWLAGDDRATVLEGIEIHATTSSPVGEITDRYLSQYFADPIKLVCPACGSGDNLVSWEMEPTGYVGTRFFQNPDNPDEPEINYDSANTKPGEDGSGFVDDIQCDNHDFTVLELSAGDLVPDGTPPNPDWKRPAKPRPTATRQQEELFQAANHLAEVINRVVPPSTAHYAVEQLRAPLDVLQRVAPGVITRDYVRIGPREGSQP